MKAPKVGSTGSGQKLIIFSELSSSSPPASKPWDKTLALKPTSGRTWTKASKASREIRVLAPPEVISKHSKAISGQYPTLTPDRTEF